jgi:hypothetical protein
MEGAGGGTDKHTIPPKPLTMATFEIPTGPAISENNLTYHVPRGWQDWIPEQGVGGGVHPGPENFWTFLIRTC